MKYRLQYPFVLWLALHTVEYWYYYLGAVFCLYFLHHYQSMIPELAKGLGEKALHSQLDEINIYLFFKLAFFILLFRTFSRLLFFYPARVQQKNLRLELIHRLERVLPNRYNDLSDGDLFARVVNDFNRIRAMIGFAFLQVGNIIIASLIFIPKINEFNDKFLIAFSPLILCVALFSIMIYFFQPYVRKNMDAYAEVQNFVIESYEAKKTIKNFQAENNFFKKFSDQSSKELDYFFTASLPRIIALPIKKIGVGASLIWGAYIVMYNDLPATDLIFFSGFLFLILEPLMFLSWIGVVTSQGYAAWTRVKELVSRTQMPLSEPWYSDTIDICNISLPFWNQSLNLNFQKAQWNVLIGETGVGKTYLLERLAEQLHFSKISYSFIQQEPYLYNASIYENIFLGNDIDHEKLSFIKQAIIDFGLDSLAQSVDDVLSLEVGENGKQISGGQAKRVALLRSLASDVDYILWDDPFSSVDLIFEQQILQKLKSNNFFKDKTFIITSHRLTTIKSCDWVVFLDKHRGIITQGEVTKSLDLGSEVNEFLKKQMV